MKTFELEYKNNKYNVNYYNNNELELVEFHSTDGVNGYIKQGYSKKDAPDWLNMKETLFKSQLFYKAISDATPNVYSTLLKVIQDGEDGVGKEQNFLDIFNLLNITWTPAELEYLDAVLQVNKFSIRLVQTNNSMSARKAVEIVENSPINNKIVKNCDNMWCKFIIFVKSIFKKN